MIDTGCFDIGGRLIKMDPQTQRISYIAPKLQTIIAEQGLQLAVGETVRRADLDRLIQEMVSVLEQSVGIDNHSPYYELLQTNHGLKLNYDLHLYLLWWCS